MHEISENQFLDEWKWTSNKNGKDTFSRHLGLTLREKSNCLEGLTSCTGSAFHKKIILEPTILKFGKY